MLFSKAYRTFENALVRDLQTANAEEVVNTLVRVVRNSADADYVRRLFNEIYAASDINSPLRERLSWLKQVEAGIEARCDPRAASRLTPQEQRR